MRSRAQLDYPAIQEQADAGTLPEPLALLPRIGTLLQARAAERGAIELGTPDQEVRATPDGGWTLAFRGDLPVEAWNAQISLLTGRCAAALMLDGGVGVLRTLPPPRPEDVERLRLLAPALGVEWPDGATPGAVISGLDPSDPGAAAFLDEAGILLRGAAYTPFDGTPPQQPGHGGVGAPYAHVTAPLRRLVDRFGTEVCLALAAGAEPAPELRAALPELPALMAASDRRTREVERAVLDATEAWVLRGREGQTFSAVVVDAEDGRGTVVLDGHAVRGRCTGEGLTPGTRVQVRLEEADVVARTVRFALDGRPVTRTPYLSARLQGFGTTVFAEMSALAAATGAVNLGQGFPDYPGPREVLDVARAAIGTAADQYPPGPGILELRQAIADHAQRFRGLGLRPRGRGPGHRRRHRGAVRGAARAARHRRRGRAVRADVRLLRRGHRDGRGRGPARPAPSAGRRHRPLDVRSRRRCGPRSPRGPGCCC